jgi:hypothetical protein
VALPKYSVFQVYEVERPGKSVPTGEEMDRRVSSINVESAIYTLVGLEWTKVSIAAISIAKFKNPQPKSLILVGDASNPMAGAIAKIKETAATP